MSARRTVTTSLVALAVAGAPAAATAASVRLNVQAPYDIATKTFNLEGLEYQNLTPVFSRSFLVPYDTIEPLLANALEEVVGRTRHFYVKCWGLGVDELCPDTDITVKIHSSFKFTQKGQPVITAIGPAANNTFRVKLDAQAKITLDAAIHHETGIWYSGNETVDIFALIGAHASVDIKLWPTPSASNLKVELTHDGGNVGIDGLTGQIIGASVVVGAAVLGPVGAILGGILGSIGAAAAEDLIKAAINEAISDQLTATNSQLRELVQAQIDPVIAQAIDQRDKALNTKIPAIGLTVAQALAVGPASLDVRTKASGSDVRVVATTRFDPTPKGKSLGGFLRFPKTQCKFAKGGNKTVGYWTVPIAIDPINTDLAGKSCDSIVKGSSFARSVYLGENPNKLLNSGSAADTLPSWQGTGNISTSGVAVDKGNYYECPYTVGNLPAAAILDLSAVKGSDLATRLDAYAFRARYLFMSLVGPAQLLDAEGKPKNATALVFGGKGPKVLGDCPSSYSAGTGFQKNRLEALKDKFDLEKCPTCGLLDFFNEGEIYENPGRDVVLAGVPQQADIARQVAKIDAEITSKAALEGVQRVQNVLDSGMLSRSWALVDKARAAAQKLRGPALQGKRLELKQVNMKQLSIKQINVKQVGPTLTRKQSVKVIDQGKALKLDFTRISDAALPGADVEILVTGKAGK
jgi:hypothetical protein